MSTTTTAVAGTPLEPRSFAGDLDEVVIYTRALSEREIKAHYTLGISVITEN